MLNSKKIGAHIGLCTATLIYGITYTAAKKVMPEFLSPYAFVLLRNLGGFIFFWIIASFIPSKKIETKDFIRIAFCALFGIVINQLMFFKGLEYTSSISGSIIMTMNPVVVMVLAFIILKEQLNKQKVLGVSLGILGALLLIFQSKVDLSAKAPNPSLGNILVFINCASYALYLIYAKSLLQKYHPFHILKWLITFSLILIIPIGIEDLLTAKWSDMPLEISLNIAFVVLATSCLAYLFNLLALKVVKPTTASIYIYGQPLVASVYAIILGTDQLDLTKIIAATFIFSGVYLVSNNKKT